MTFQTHIDSSSPLPGSDALRSGSTMPQGEFGTWSDLINGDWKDAMERADAADGTAIAEAVRAVVAGLRGEADAARRSAARAERLAIDRRDIIVGVQLARALAWLANADPRAAYQSLATLYPNRQVLPGVGAMAGIGIFAHIAARIGEAGYAREVLASAPDIEVVGVGEEVAVAELVLDTGTALENAVCGSTTGSAFVVGRLSLDWGLRLRRDSRPRDARAPLQAALDLFDELDAGAWRNVASRELRAAGGSGVAETSALGLSPQELAVARAVSLGLTNKEVADRLFLSPRTVGGHLYVIFPKLGISSRLQLVHWFMANFRESEQAFE